MVQIYIKEDTDEVAGGGVLELKRLVIEGVLSPLIDFSADLLLFIPVAFELLLVFLWVSRHHRLVLDVKELFGQGRHFHFKLGK